MVSAGALNVVGFLNLIPSRKSSRCCLAIWFTKVEARDRFLKTSLQKLQINSSAKYSSSSFSGEGGGNSTLQSLTSFFPCRIFEVHLFKKGNINVGG